MKNTNKYSLNNKFTFGNEAVNVNKLWNADIVTHSLLSCQEFKTCNSYAGSELIEHPVLL